MEHKLLALIKGCRQNDRKCQHLLYKMFYGYGVSIAIRYVKSENEAIEVLNMSFMKIFTNMKKYDSNKPLKPWIRRIIINTSITYMKQNNKYKFDKDLAEAINVSSTDDIISRLGYQQLITIVQSLSASYRSVFNMYVIDGYKHVEIAKELGISVGTSKSNLSKARKILQQKVSQLL